MRVFVTGGTGFIGLHLCRRLVARGDQVVALVRNRRKAERLPAEVERFEGDLSIFEDPGTVLPECDVMVHLAGVVAAAHSSDYDTVNRAAVKALLDCVGRQRFVPRRLLFTSSLAAAGPSGERPWSETDAPRPIDPYGVAKARAEEMVRGAPFPTTSFRPPVVLGPGDDASLTLFKAAQSGLGFRVAGPPQRLSFVDVRDLVEAIVLMADDTRPGSYVYFAGHPQEIDVRQLWTELARAVGRDVKVLPVPRWGLYLAMHFSTLGSRLFGFTNQLDRKQYLQMTAPAWVCSSEALQRDLGWRPAHDLAACTRNAAEGYRQSGLLGPTRAPALQQ